MTFLPVGCFAGSNCWCWWHYSVSHLVLGQRRHLRPALHLTSLDLHFGCLRHCLETSTESWNIGIFAQSKAMLRCACVRPQECCVKMVTNGIFHEERQPGGLREGNAERMTVVFEFLLVVTWLNPTGSVVYCGLLLSLKFFILLHWSLRARSVIGKETMEQLATSTSVLHVLGHDCEVCTKKQECGKINSCCGFDFQVLYVDVLLGSVLLLFSFLQQSKLTKLGTPLSVNVRVNGWLTCASMRSNWLAQNITLPLSRDN